MITGDKNLRAASASGHPVRRHKRESGQAAILIVLAMSIFLIGALGLAIDASMLYGHRQMAQSAADAAAQSGMLSIFHGTNATASNPFATGTTPAPFTCTTTDGRTPCAYARLNGFGGTADDTVSIDFPTSVPSVSLVSGNSSALNVRVQRTVNATIMGMLGFRTFTVAATAIAAMVKFPMANCITALNSTVASAFATSGATNLNLTSCGIAVDSSSTSAFRASGNVSITATDIDVVGGTQLNGNVTVHPTPTTNSPSFSDPLASVPAPTFSPAPCLRTNLSLSGGTTTLDPGVYFGGMRFSGNAVVNFNPGTYILLGGGFNASGTSNLSGSNVTLYNTFDATHTYTPISMSGNFSATLSASTSGPLAGMLFFQDRNAPLGSTESFSGNASSNFTGAIYFPRSLVSYSGNASAAIQNISIVANTVSFSGNASLKSDPSAPGAVQQIKVALVQ